MFFVHLCVYIVLCISVCALSPLAVIVAEAVVDGGFQVKEMLLHCSSDGSLNYPGNTHKMIHSLIF